MCHCINIITDTGIIVVSPTFYECAGNVNMARALGIIYNLHLN